MLNAEVLRDGGSYLVAVIVFLAAMYAWRKDVSAAAAAVIGSLWVAALTLEYWLFGDSSFLHYYDEGDQVLPFLLYVNQYHLGGDFAHAYAGGTDIIGAHLNHTQLFSIERLLFGVLPLWVAVASNKIMVAGIGMFGGFTLVRATSSVDRLTALAIAALYTVASYFVIVVTIHHGMGFAIIPLAVYIVTVRVDARYYFVRILILSIVTSSSTTITHAFIALMATVFFATFLFGTWRNPKVWAAMAVLVAIAVINWASALYAAGIFASQSLKILEHARIFNLPQAVQSAISLYEGKINWPIQIMLPVGLAVMWLCRDPRARRTTLIMFGIMMIGPALNLVPWNAIGLKALAGVLFVRMAHGMPVLLLPVLAWAVVDLRKAAVVERWPLSGRVVPALFLAGAVGGMALHKIENTVNYLGTGGQKLMTSIPNLANPDWAPDHPFRVVTVSYQLRPMIPVAYGLNAFDGNIHVLPVQTADYWRYGVMRPRKRIKFPANAAAGPNVSTQLYVIDESWVDLRCCDAYRLADHADLNFLRLANVEFVISQVPLKDKSLTLVSGPDTPYRARHGLSFVEKIADDIQRIRSPGPVRIYRLSGALPMAYFASTITNLAVSTTNPAYYDAIANRDEARAAVIRRAPDARPIPAGSGEIVTFSPVVNGYDVTTETPNGGLLIVNTMPLAYWRATVDGKPAETLPVNGGQVGIVLPANAHKVELRYARPRLRDVLAKFWP